jgi:DNA-binding NarL/FixJ family response regulator
MFGVPARHKKDSGTKSRKNRCHRISLSFDNEFVSSQPAGAVRCRAQTSYAKKPVAVWMPSSLSFIDDHWIVRAGLRALLVELGGVEIVGEASNGREALEMVAEHQPRLVLRDIVMPVLGGVEATRRIVKEYPNVRVIILSMHTGGDYVLEALRAGASGYIHKGSAPRQLEYAIESVARGEIFLSPAVSKCVVEGYLSQPIDQTSSMEQLTSRQREILQLVAEGHSSKQIAGILNTSVKTIDSHRANIMERLGIQNVPGLVRYAIRHGLVSADK